MRIKSKIKAFTLSEMLVVIIITSIVVGLAFSVLTLVQKQMRAIEDNFENTTELNKLEQSLWIGFDMYSKIEYNKEKDLLLFTNALDTLQYTFTKESIIKEKDTFSVQINHKTLFFDGDSIQQGYVDAIKLETTNPFLNKHIFVYKQNDAALYFD